MCVGEVAATDFAFDEERCGFEVGQVEAVEFGVLAVLAGVAAAVLQARLFFDVVVVECGTQR